MNRLNPEPESGNDLPRSLDHVLAAVIDRARRAVRTPAMRAVAPELRRIFTLGLQCQRVLRRAAVRIGPADGADAPISSQPFGPDAAEALARKAGVLVTCARHSFADSGERAAEAMEQAFLLTRMGFLAAEAGREDPEGDPLAAFVWDDGTPMGHAKLPGHRTATLVAARPSAPGRGLAVATVCGHRAGAGARRDLAADPHRDGELILTLLVPGSADDLDPHAWMVELRTTPGA